MLAASWSPKSRQRRAMMPSVSNLSLTSATQTVAAHIPVKDSEEELRRRQSMHGKSSTPPTRATATATATSMPAGKVDAGEDAFFHVSTPSRVALGVADGVGGWSEFGVDPAQFSWALMENAEKMAHLTDNIADMHDDPASRDRVLDAQTILDGAYHRLVESGKVEAGSSTACILSLCKITGTLRASNLGDSSFLLIRDKRCIYESPSQQHFWNCPYQLTIVPPGFRASKAPAKKNKSYVQDLPKDAVQSTHQLEDGDVIVLATDGFWDNVFTKDTLELVEKELGDVIRDKRHQLAHHRRRHHPSSASTSISTTSSMMAPYNHHPLPLQHLSQQLQSEELVTVQQKADGAISLSIEQDKDDDMNSPPLTAQEVVERVRALSRRLTNTARHISLDQTRITPFSEGSSHLHSGGKVDDITVIVTLVRSI
ncbi:Protein phosphatase PTC7 [Podila humilis]|nr:Protein phosphatase PTC7 [Podila humilis]